VRDPAGANPVPVEAAVVEYIYFMKNFIFHCLHLSLPGSYNLILFILVGISSSFSEESNTVEYKFQYYKDNDGVKVLSNDVGAGMKLSDHFKIKADYLVDAITGASRRDRRDTNATLAKVDGVTSATSVDGVSSATTREQRHQISGALSFLYDLIKHFRADKNNDDPTTFTLIGSNSDENDYTSRTVGLSLAQDLFQRNTTVSFTFGKSFDQWNPVSWAIPGPTDAGWNYLGNGRRQTSRYSLGLTQGITTTTIASLNGDYVYDRGYLAKPYYVMQIGNKYYRENLPSERTSVSVTGLLNQYVPIEIPNINGIALHGEYRWYHDTWAITSHTASAEVYVRLFDNYIVRPLYRRYWQSSANFYQDSYQTVPVYLTTDLKYREGFSQTFGLKLSWEVVDFVKPANARFPFFLQSFDIAGNFYFRKDPISQAIVNSHYGYWKAKEGYQMYWIQTGIKFAF